MKKLELVQDLMSEFGVSEVHLDGLFSGMSLTHKGRFSRSEFAEALEEIAFLCGGEAENAENWELD